MEVDQRKFKLIVIGGSLGGVEAVMYMLSKLKPDIKIPIVILMHQMKNAGSLMTEIFQHRTKLIVKEPNDKEKFLPSHIYIAPPDFHLMIECDDTFSYTVSEPVNHSRPSIDVLFESAAEAVKEKLAAILLTGASSDGAYGMKKIKDHGGYTIVQNPATAKSSFMPQSAINMTPIDCIENLENITQLINNLNHE